MLRKPGLNCTLVCTRPAYTLGRLQTDLTRRSYSEFGSAVLGHEIEHEVDTSGLVWVNELYSGKHLLELFISNPTIFMNMIARRVLDFNESMELIRVANEMCREQPPNWASLALKKLAEVYVRCLKYAGATNVLCEDAFAKLDCRIRELLPTRMVEHYLSALKHAPAAKYAAQIGFYEDVRDTKRIESVNSQPFLMFSGLRLLESFAQDGTLGITLSSNERLIPEVWALRSICPLMVQCAEEWRVADYSLRSHFRFILTHVQNNCWKDPDPYGLTVEEIIDRL